MDQARIVMVSPLPELTRLARQISRELNFEMGIVEAYLDQGVELGKKLEQSGVELVISRGPTGVLLKKELSIPVILMQITSFDIALALNRAKGLGQKIAYFDHIKRKGIYDFQSIAEILSLENLQYYFYHNAKELEDQIVEASEKGIEAVVASGICVLRMAREQGMEGVMIFSSRESIVDALERARDIIFIRQKDREKTEFLTTIIDHTHDGVIAVNKKCLLTHFNSAAEKAFNIPAGNVVGKKVKEIPVPLLQSFFQNPGPAKGVVQNIEDRQIVFNHMPIHMDGEPLGAVVTFQSVDKIQNLEVAIRKKLHADGLTARYHFNDLIGSSTEFRKAISRARKCACADSPVLVTGEKGSGRKSFIHSIHNASLRHQGPFVLINCANTPEEQLESELFGYEEGTFTGVRKGAKQGLFELAHNGTIVIDEISDLSLSLQSNLLRVLQEKVVRRIGGERLIPVNVRVIAATSRFLPAEIKKGKFREDLFFQINVLNLHIPPLRNRKSDIPLLVDYFALKFRKNDNYREQFPASVYRFLGDYDWPGNVQELENFMEKYAILSEGSRDKDNFRLMEELVDELYRFREDPGAMLDDHDNYLTVQVGTLEEMEQEIIEKLYRQTDLDKKSLANRLGISRTTLWKRLKTLRG
ncbi:MAG: sigma 54-interacting transcriptional regulator [Dethiobacteria bacterium]|jgi:transcriptional regulator with PAS, ATPase and Fis domain